MGDTDINMDYNSRLRKSHSLRNRIRLLKPSQKYHLPINGMDIRLPNPRTSHGNRAGPSADERASLLGARQLPQEERLNKIRIDIGCS